MLLQSISKNMKKVQKRKKTKLKQIICLMPGAGMFYGYMCINDFEIIIKYNEFWYTYWKEFLGQKRNIFANVEYNASQ